MYSFAALLVRAAVFTIGLAATVCLEVLPNPWVRVTFAKELSTEPGTRILRRLIPSGIVRKESWRGEGVSAFRGLQPWPCAKATPATSFVSLVWRAFMLGHRLSVWTHMHVWGPCGGWLHIISQN